MLLVWAVGSSFDIQQVIVPTEKLAVEGGRVRLSDPKLWPEGSTWKASLNDLTKIANR